MLLRYLLSERSQLVAAENVNNSVVNFKAGVPEVSVLAPLLFNIDVNDLFKVISNPRVYQYTDDTILPSRHMNYSDLLTSIIPRF